jgi:hypothetical protein
LAVCLLATACKVDTTVSIDVHKDGMTINTASCRFEAISHLSTQQTRSDARRASSE